MITRPLDLASKLRPEPRSYDALFFVNVGLIGLFFVLFGSRFVLAPGLGVDFRMPEMTGAVAGATATDRVISVRPAGQIFADDGLLNLPQLQDWLKTAVRGSRQRSLLIRASADVRTSELQAAHDQLVERERSLRFLADTMPQLVWTVRPDGTSESFNQGWRDYAGMSDAQLHDQGWIETMHPDDRPQLARSSRATAPGSTWRSPRSRPAASSSAVKRSPSMSTSPET